MVQNALAALLVQSPHLNSFPIYTGSLQSYFRNENEN